MTPSEAPAVSWQVADRTTWRCRLRPGDVPLYRRTLTWAMDRKVRAVQWPNDTVELRWVRISEP